MTEAERRVWQILRSQRMRGHKFRRQVPIGRYIADFVCHEARLVLEIDGGQHDRLSPRETERSAFLQSQGYRLLRFWNSEVLRNPDGVYETIAEALGRLTAEPTRHIPSPFMGESRGEGASSASRLDREGTPGITPTQTLPHQGGGLSRSGTR